MTVKEMGLASVTGQAFFIHSIVVYILTVMWYSRRMADTIDNLVLELLRAMRADIEEIKRDLHEVKSEVISLRIIMGEFIKADARREGSIASLEHRVERLERRSGLVDA